MSSNIIELADKRRISKSLGSNEHIDDPLSGEQRAEMADIAREAALTAIANLYLLGEVDSLSEIAFSALTATQGHKLTAPATPSFPSG